MAEVQFQPVPQNVINETPTTGKIMIVPFKPKMLRDQADAKYRWGGIKRSGYMSIGGKPIDGWAYHGATLSIDGSGIILSMDNEEHRRLYMIFKYSDQFKGVVSERKDKRYPASKFYFQNNELEIQQYLKAMREGDELVDRLRSLSPDGVNRLALWFGIAGSDELKKGMLRKMTETEDGKAKLQDILYNPDREIMELIAVAESKGDMHKKEGLWANRSTGIYFWNQEAIGVGKPSVIAYLKKNTDLQMSMRQLYMSEALAAQSIPQEPKKEEPKIENPNANLKVVDPEKDNTKQSDLKFTNSVGTPAGEGRDWTIEQLVEAYNKQEVKSAFQLGEKFLTNSKQTHHATIKKMLKDKGITFE